MLCWSLLRPKVTTQQWSWASAASGLLYFSYDIKFYIQQRYVTGVVMEGALRAPGLMADIVQVLVALTGNVANLGRKDNKQG